MNAKIGPFVGLLLKKGISVVFMVLLFVSLMSFTADTYRMEQQERRVQQWIDWAQDFRDVVRVDSVRQAAIDKVVQLIGKYNRRMSREEKLAIANEIYRMSVKYDNLDIDLICATITHETAFTWRTDIVSPVGAMGLMQIMPHTGYYLSRHEGIKWTGATKVLFNPIYNIRMGCRYLSTLIELYEVDGGLAAYNGGERRAARWLASGRNNQVLFEETREYVPAVLRLYNTYKN
ncbi:MAG: lytic transglycosylase domain-containing protein [Calditrichaeota bacterium]|nr:MAG: lytic transglycosylase domain-containing protein [Calditrichota bacterium]